MVCVLQRSKSGESMHGLERDEPRALIVGAKGQVGSQMKRALEAEGGPGRVLATAREPEAGWLQLDLAELSDAAQADAVLRDHALDMILCVGGMTFVDGCEAEPDVAHRINARGPAVLAAYARGRGLPFVYFSTEYVFDGTLENAGPYAEDAETRPLSVYGRSKLDGEHGVFEAHSQALVIRTTVVYGPDERRKNYVYSLMKNLAAGTPMMVPEDQVSTPTYNRDLARATLGLVAAGESGVFNVCGPELMGRMQFARSVAERLGLDASLLRGVKTAELKQAAARPLHAGLSTEKLRRLHPELTMRTLGESLQDCDNELRSFSTL